MKQFWKNMGLRGLYLVIGAVTLAVVLAVNILMGALSDRYPMSIDLTPGRIFALSEDTRQYLSELESPVSIQVLATRERFENTSVYNAQASEMMGQVAKHSDQVSLEYIDYISDPAFASRYPQFTLKHGDVLVSGGDKVRHVKTEELFQYGYTSSGSLTITASQAEQTILSAILYVLSEEVPQAVFLQGHGESELAVFRTLLSDNNFDVTQGSLLTGGLADTAKLVVLAAPTSDLSLEEIDLLAAYLENGGSYGKTLLYCASPQQGPVPNLDAFLAEWGVRMGDGLVFETDPARVYSTQPFYAVANYASQTYADLVRDEKVPMLVPVSRPMEVLFAQQEAYYTETLLEFGATSGVRPSDAGEGFTADQAARKGPMPALVLASRRQVSAQNATQVQARSNLLASGSVEMLEAFGVGSTAFANSSYLTALLGRLCGQEPGLSVPPKQIVGQALNLTQAQADSLGIVFVAAVPGMVLLLGIVVWLKRRHQ